MVDGAEYAIVEGVDDDDMGNVNFNGVEDAVGNLNVERSVTEEGLTPTTVDLIKIICTILRVGMYKINV